MTQKYLKIEVLAPYIASLVFLLTIRFELPPFIYLILSLLLASYFFPLRLFTKTEGKKWFYVVTSLLFANILTISSLYLFNQESRVLQNGLGVMGILCMVLILYKFIFEKLDVISFLLLFGFVIVSSLYL